MEECEPRQDVQCLSRFRLSFSSVEDPIKTHSASQHPLPKEVVTARDSSFKTQTQKG